MFHSEGLYFETTTSSTKKHFKVSFPFDAYLALRWDDKELKKLRKYEESEYICDKLLMLALIAEKIERKPIMKKVRKDGTQKT